MHQTSLDAYRTAMATGLIRGVRERVFTAIANNPNLTQNEYYQIVGKRENTVRPRFSELLRMNAIEVTGERRCRITNIHCCTWGIKNAAIVALPPVKTKDQIIKDLTIENAELKRRLKQYELL